MSLKDGPGEGGWAVFAEKVTAERDAAENSLAEAEDRLAHELGGRIDEAAIRDMLRARGLPSTGRILDAVTAAVKHGEDLAAAAVESVVAKHNTLAARLAEAEKERDQAKATLTTERERLARAIKIHDEAEQLMSADAAWSRFEEELRNE